MNDITKRYYSENPRKAHESQEQQLKTTERLTDLQNDLQQLKEVTTSQLNGLIASRAKHRDQINEMQEVARNANATKFHTNLKQLTDDTKLALTHIQQTQQAEQGEFAALVDWCGVDVCRATDKGGEGKGKANWQGQREGQGRNQ